MDIRNRRAVKYTASQAVASNPGKPRLTVLIYVAVMALSALLVSALVMVLDNQIANTGGLSNLGLRSILSTIQTVLPLVQAVALWGVQMGYQKATLHMARRQAAGPRNLLEGFSFFGPLLRSMLLQGGLYFLLALGASYASAFVYLMTPLSADFFTLIEPLMADSSALYDAMYNDAAFYQQASNALLPVIPIFLVVFLAAAAPFFYQYRMTNYCILDDPRKGALAAMRDSARMMKHNRVSLLKLDLSFWWFYLGQAVVAVVLYGDVLLPMVGVTLPWSATVSYYVFYVASLVLEGVLYYCFLNRVETTYATVYEELRPKPQPGQGGVVLGNIFDLAKGYKED